jgi:parallel beta-helix repeat protein
MKKKLLIILQIVLFSCLAFVSTEVSATRYYVHASASGTNTGASWTDAYTSLQSAIASAASGDEVWVAAGTYYPSAYPAGASGSSARDYSFYLDGGVQLYGGFAGTETTLAARDYATNVTILSGDIGTANTTSDNCHHVVMSVNESTAGTLDGFTVTLGNANVWGDLTVNTLAVTRHSGGIYNRSSSPNIANCTFTNNTASQHGGGMYNTSSSPTVSNCTFSENTVGGNGGGMYNIASSSPTITNCTFSDNTAGTSGGGMLNEASSPTITNCTFSDNTVSDNGGAMYNSSASSPSITNCTFSDNTASDYGGGVYNTSSSPTITNCTFSDNTASDYGGGMVNWWQSFPSISNCTFSKNTAANGGGGMYNSNSSPTIANSIFWGNLEGSSSTATGSDIENSGTNTSTITYTTLQVYSGGTGCSTSDPLFVDASTPAGADGIHRTADDGLRLYSASPAANSGSNSAIPSGITTDIIGSARTQNTTVNMGAYEDLQYITYVDASASGTNTGASWTNAYTSLQSAIASAASGDYIWVAAGTYYPSAYPAGASGSSNRDYSFFLAGGVQLYGGFAGTETTLAARDYTTNVTILSGDIGTANTTSDNCHHVVVSAVTTAAGVLDGFTVTRGNANGSGYFMLSTGYIYRSLGGGMLNRSSSPSIANCTFSYNTATNGGGLYNNYASPTVSNCTFSNNTASSTGGGICNYPNARPTITNTTFSNNTANHGGGVYAHTTSHTTVSNCTFIENTATTNGGGMHNDGSCSSIITNATFSDNTAGSHGGGMYNGSSSPTIANSVFWGNVKGSSSTATGSDIENSGANTSTITYTTLQLASSSYTSTNNNLFTGGTGNLYAQDPLFVDASDPVGADGIHRTADDGLRLFSNSPAANSGNNDSIPSGITTDIIGSARTQNTTVNMGAYEDLTTVCSATSALPTTASTTYTADYKNTDANGWTNYCSVDEKLLLSLKIGSSGAVVAASEVELKLGSSTTYTYVGNDGGMISTGNKGYVMIDRRWDVSPTTQPSSNVGVKYYFTNSEYTDLASALSTHNSSATGYPSTLSAVTDVDLFKSTSGSAFADPHTVSGIIIDNGSTLSTTVWNHSTHGTTDHSAEFEVSSFSGGGGGGGGGGGTGTAPLPVALMHFTAQAIAHTIAELNWATATEIDNSHFVIERSYDGLPFEAIDRVEGNGNSDAVLHYAYTDRGIAQGSEVVYYRLHQFDYNGTSEYSDVRKVSFGMNNLDKPSIAIYPNPFTSDVYINVSTLSGAEATIRVANLSGQQLLERSLNATQSIEKVDLSSLPKGIYFVYVTSVTGTTVVKVIKG